MEQQIRFCKTSDGVRIAYAIVGQGPPLVRVLGWFTHLEFEWQTLRSSSEPLAENHLLVRYDGRGMGLSDRDVQDFSLEAQVRDLEAVVDALRLRHCAMLAWSQGGPTAIAYAVRHPERVSRLILYGSYARMPLIDTEEGRKQIAFLDKLIRHGWGSDLPAHRQFFTGLFMPDADPDAIPWFNELQRVSTSAENAAAAVSAFSHFDVTGLLPEIRIPTLVIHRRGDAISPFEWGRDLAALIPGARFVPLEGRNHAILAGDPQFVQYCRVVEEFLAEERKPVKPKAPTPAAPSEAVHTILFTDMEGSTALTQRLGDAKGQQILRAHNTIVRDALKACGGSEIKHTGDGIMASFPSASRALECAIAIQRAVAARVEEHPDILLRVRIGLNAGEPVVEDEDLFGTAVQLAARICAHAEPGQILVPTVVRELAAGKGFLLADLGQIALRGFEDPVRLYEVRWREEG
jgi:class 3 adenylate cyclase